MYYYNRKKEIIRNVVLTTLILLIAVVSTHYIYYKFQGERNIDLNSESLDIVFHEKEGDSITINKITPVTDSVGLSSKYYTFTIKNNLTEPVNYKIKLVDDKDKILEDECGEYLIGKESIRVSLKEEGQDTKIYTLKELNDSVLETTKIKALDEKNYTVRVWINKDSTLPIGGNLHYHGTIKVVED